MEFKLLKKEILKSYIKKNILLKQRATIDYIYIRIPKYTIYTNDKTQLLVFIYGKILLILFINIINLCSLNLILMKNIKIKQ